jgi:hypothetical protein
MMNRQKIMVFALFLILLICASALAFATYEIWSSNQASTRLGDQASLTIATNETSGTIGDAIHLTATLSDGLSGVVVSFFWNTTNYVDEATTNVSGMATVDFNTTLLTAGTYYWNASVVHP